VCDGIFDFYYIFFYTPIFLFPLFSFSDCKLYMSQTLLTDGLVAFVKKACPTCSMIEPQLQQVSRTRKDFQVITQDDVHFPSQVVDVVDDRELDFSYLNDIEATPTLIHFVKGQPVERVMGWDREAWARLSGISNLGQGLPAIVPG